MQNTTTGLDYVTFKHNKNGNPSNTWSDNDGSGPNGVGFRVYTGRSLGSGTDSDYATIKYNASNGNPQWASRYDGGSNVYVTGITGLSIAYAGTLKYDLNGNLSTTWSDNDGGGPNATGVRKYTGTGTYAQGNAIVLKETFVYVAGATWETSTKEDYLTIQYDQSDGDQNWVTKYDHSQKGDRAYAVAVDAEGYVCVTGESDGGSTKFDYATLR